MGWAHSWVVLRYNGEIKHIDVYKGIQEKDTNRNIYNSFMMSTKKLINTREYRIKNEDRVLSTIKPTTKKYKKTIYDREKILQKINKVSIYAK